MTKRSLLIVLRLFFGLLTLIAVSVQINRLVERGAFRAVNFFSYFISPQLRQRIFAADVATLEEWVERVLDAPDLPSVFASN